MLDPFLVAVTLHVFPGQEEAFEDYERHALQRMLGHRGRIIARMRCAESARGDAEPYEFHLLSFPSEAAFEAFVASSVPYEEERLRVISKTHILKGAALSLPKDR